MNERRSVMLSFNLLDEISDAYKLPEDEFLKLRKDVQNLLDGLDSVYSMRKKFGEFSSTKKKSSAKKSSRPMKIQSDASDPTPEKNNETIRNY